MNSMLKNIIKKTSLYRNYYCISKRAVKLYKYKNMDKKHAYFLAKKDTIAIINNRNKVQQIKKIMFHSIPQNYSTEKRFFYYINETCIPYNSSGILDNFPVNYEIVLKYSLAQLKEFIKKNAGSEEIKKQSLEIIHIVSDYCKKIHSILPNNITFQIIYDHPAISMEDALQRILLWNQILWQTGHTLNGLGRLDVILEDYYNNERSKQYYQDLIISFLNVLHEYYIFKSGEMLGDTGQIIILGGSDETSYYCNDLTYLFLECLYELKLPDPKVMLRVSKKGMPNKLLSLAGKCIASGLGSPLLANDDVIVPALIKFGYTKKDAYDYVVSACWEPLSYGRSLEQNNLYNINFAEAFVQTIERIGENSTFDAFMNDYKIQLCKQAEAIINSLDKKCWEKDPIISIFTKDCILNGVDISAGGAKYNNYGILSVGIANAVDSILNLKKYIFQYQILNISTAKEIISNNYKGNEKWLKIFQSEKERFGVDIPAIYELSNELMETVSQVFKTYTNKFSGKVKIGFSSPGYLALGAKTKATLDGRMEGVPFHTHISSSISTPCTELVRFASHLNYEGNKSNGNVVDVILQPNFVEEQFDKFLHFMKANIVQGFFQMQCNVVSYKTLIEAKKKPELYQNLIVRVWGFSAYFNDLSDEYKDLLIRRAKQYENICKEG